MIVYNAYYVSLILSVCISALLAVFIWRRRPVPGAAPVAVTMLAIVVWSLGYILELKNPGLTSQLLTYNVQYLGIVTVPIAFLVFVLQYTGHDRILTRRNKFLLAIIPTITVLLVWTKDYHSLMWSGAYIEIIGPFSTIERNFGIWYWVHVGYSYSAILIGSILIFLRIFRPPRIYHGQAIALLVAVFLPWASNIIYVFNLHPDPVSRIDITPTSFTIVGLILAWGIFRYRLLGVVPIARHALIENMNDGIVVLDTRNRFVDINPAAQRILNCPLSKAIGRPVHEVFSVEPEFTE